MFTVDQLNNCLSETWFVEGYRSLERCLLEHRLGINHAPSVVWRSELVRLSKAVLGSVSEWSLSEPMARKVTAIAADIEAAFAVLAEKEGNHRQRRQNILCASILYDLAGFTGTAGSQIERDGFPSDVRSYFSRRHSWWRQLLAEEPTQLFSFGLESTSNNVFDEAMAEVLDEFGYEMQRTRMDIPTSGSSAMRTLIDIASSYDIGFDGDAMTALQTSLKTRWHNSTLRVLSQSPNLNAEVLRKVRAPVELWPAQKAAIDRGLLRDQITSFGLAAPTGTGKTALTTLLLAEFFEKHPTRKAIYVSPSRALTAEIAKNLAAALRPLGVSVAAMGAAMTLEDSVIRNAADADLLVFTPEKADLLLRVAPELIEQTELVIVDEAHHIEQGTRGIILEFYLWRLRSLISATARIVQLSAVAPNIHELVEWLGSRETSVAVKLDWRSTRLRLGVFEYANKTGSISFGDSEGYQLFDRGECSAVNDEMLAQLADRLSSSGVVLLLCMSPGRAETLAQAIADLRKRELPSPKDRVSERLDARIERELFPASPLRSRYRKRVIFHHAQLPPRIRSAIERAIAERHIDIVCATTTLAEGVNFPFSTVLVESLIGKNYQLSPRSLWNIAGRAGRFGVDSEGHCIIFRPSRWKKDLKQYRLEDYLSVKLDDIPPVKSALATGLTELKSAVDDSEIALDSLREIDLKEITIDGKTTNKAKRIRGLINVMRVGYAHASVSRTMSLDDTSAPEFSSGLLLAAKQIPDRVKEFASVVGAQQREVISDVLQKNDSLLKIAARVGWSLETQQSLFEWVHTRENWQLEQFGNLVAHGHIQTFDSLGYLIGPLAKMMSEFEGEKLGGFTSFIATEWLRGVPITSIRQAQKPPPGKKRIDFGRLVHVIYSRIQYLLPWALFGLNELVQYEVKLRSLHVNDGIGQLSVLASEGVPSFDALHLVLEYDVERVDATRLAAAFRQRKRETDIVGWLRSQNWQTVVGIVRGSDRRRLDPDLQTLFESLQKTP